MPEVVVIGAGPVGILLSSHLRRRGIDVVVLDKRLTTGDSSRAIGVHAPVLAALEATGETEQILSAAVRVGRGECHDGTGRLLGAVRFDRLSARFPFVATLPQPLTETALASGATDASPGGSAEVHRGMTVTAIVPTAHRVRVRAVSAAGEHEWEASAVVVAGGAAGRGLVYPESAVAARHYPDRYVMADLDVGAREDAEIAVVTLAPGGVLESFPLPQSRRRFVAWDGRGDGRGDEPATGDLDRRLRHALAERGEEGAATAVEGATTFRVRRVVAPAMRRGRVLVVGDSAHEVSPIGGQGMNLGLLDAIGLAPLLAEWIRTGTAPDTALESWERRRVRSARIAAAIATLNTTLGRPRAGAGHAVRSAALRALLRGPSGTLFAHAYSMGFDRGA